MPSSAIAVGSDSNGYDLKQVIVEYLVSLGLDVTDFSVAEDGIGDYPDVGGAVAEAVRDGSFARAILVCGTGAGMAIVANKVPGVRAVCVADPYTAERARASNDAQIMTLGSQITAATLALRLVAIWLASEFQGGRSAPKVAKIGDVERRYTPMP